MIKVAVLLYNPFDDPLIQGNFWVFIEDIQSRYPSRFVFHFICFEDDNCGDATPQRKISNKELESLNVKVTRLRWHPGTSVSSKLRDISAAFFQMARLRLKGYKHVITYNSVAASFGTVYAQILGQTLMLYSYEPHSEYACDSGLLDAGSLQHRALGFLERRAASRARVVTSGTRFMKDRLKAEWKVRAEFFQLPSVTDDRKFEFSAEERSGLRVKLGIPEDKIVLFYPGKFGGLYYNEEIPRLFKAMHSIEPRMFFLVLTPQSRSDVASLFQREGVPDGAYHITRVDYAEVHHYFSAADLGLIAVPPAPSKRFVSNIKVGEYLCSGLPYLIPRGVSEDYIFAEENGVGVVLETFDAEGLYAKWEELQKFTSMTIQERVSLCAEAGKRYRGFSTLKSRFEQAINALVA